MTHQFLFDPALALDRMHAAPSAGFYAGDRIVQLGFPEPTGQAIVISGEACGGLAPLVLPVRDSSGLQHLKQLHGALDGKFTGRSVSAG